MAKNPNDLWPTESPSADEMIRYLLARGLWCHHKLMMGPIPSRPDRDRALITEMQHAFGVVLLLKRIAAFDADEDAAARELWAFIEAGDPYGEWLYEWAIEADIDPADYTTGGDR